MRSRPRAVLLTNIPAPYRLPVWRHLEQHLELTILCLQRSEPNRSWAGSEAGTGLDVRILDSRRVTVPRTHTFLYLTREAGRIVRSVEPDVVIVGGWESPAYWDLLVSARRLQVPVVLFYSSTVASHRYQRGPVAALRKFIVKSVDAAVATGPTAAAAMAAMGLASDRIVTGFNTVDVDWFRDRAQASRAANPNDAEYAFLYVGQLIPRKGVDNALRAFSRIRRPGESFAIAGTGPSAEALACLAQELGVGDSVVFLGHCNQEDLVRAYAMSRTLVLPSIEEVWGLVVNEALACGLQVVVSRLAGVAESVAGMTGVFVADPDPDSLATAMDMSRHVWVGPISQPAILDHGPKQLADQIFEAANLALTTRDRTTSESTRRYLWRIQT
jgi:glycosyltransferase involved in cell wall biosynthesis